MKRTSRYLRMPVASHRTAEYIKGSIRANVRQRQWNGPTNLAFPAPTPRTRTDGSCDAMLERVARGIESGGCAHWRGGGRGNHAWRVLEGRDLHGGRREREKGAGRSTSNPFIVFGLDRECLYGQRRRRPELARWRGR